MVDLSKLDPVTAARHLGNPEGEIGIAIGDQMNRTNGALNQAAFERLRLRGGESILEVGFGNGKLVPMLMALMPDLTYTGIDISATMVGEAERFNQDPVAAGRARFRVASVEAIPFPDGAFNRALTVNTIYFWPDPVNGLREIRRVLCRDGVLITAAITPESAVQFRIMDREHGFRLYDAAQLRDMHGTAGFCQIEIELCRFETTNPLTGATLEYEQQLVRGIA